jgi:hypothetical protein
MVERVLSGGAKLDEYLANLAGRMSGELSVGFLEGATYPDGTPVAAVAFWDEFGRGSQPPRPFFRRMIAAESPTWGPKLARLAKVTNFDGEQSLRLLGEDIRGALQQSINTFTAPPLAPSTIAAKGFAKPLIDTAVMLRAVDYEVTP